ncbi:HAD family hydrolase [Candidatus Micrarchaeota archaeon]|nr:HAD family hydrolase [Candidatus Micrarchaeota archaeon]
MIKSILFDMDGVLINSEPAWIKVHEHLFKKYGLVWNTDEYDNHIRGKPLKDILKYLYKKGLPERLGQRFKRERGLLYLKNDPKLFPTVITTLRKLKKSYLLGLVTSTDRWLTERLLKRKRLRQFFEVVVTGDEILRGKPDPWPYMYAMTIMETLPEETVIVEDSIIGVKSAVRSGAFVVAVTNTFSKDELPGADAYIAQLSDIEHVLESM